MTVPFTRFYPGETCQKESLTPVFQYDEKQKYVMKDG